MAKRRMLSRRISQSKKVNRLSLKAQIVWTWTIPFLDDFGCYTADPEDIKTEVLPKNKRISEKSLEGLLRELQVMGLIHLYQVNSQRYQQYIGFDTFQSFRADRDRQSEYPAYKEGLDDSGIPETTNDSLKLREGKLREDKYSDSFKDFWEAFVGRWNVEKGRHDKGGKMEAFEEWKILTESQQSKATKAASQTGSEITKDACRWLKYHRWEDFEAEPPKEDTAAEQKALERKRQKIRKEHGQYYRERTTTELETMLKDKRSLKDWWLIKEIIAEKVSKS